MKKFSAGALLTGLLILSLCFGSPAFSFAADAATESTSPASYAKAKTASDAASPFSTDSLEEAAVYLREKIVARETPVDLTYTTTKTYDMRDREAYSKAVSADASATGQEIFDLALEHTGVPDEGDYLKYQYGGYEISASYSRIRNTNYFDFHIDMIYYTDEEQEAAVTEKIDALFDEFNLVCAGDYEKLCTIYDYICENVTYDYDHVNDTTYTTMYTAYGALINGTAVCQGYAALFYRMALEAGIDARIISGTLSGGPHGWNIVKLGDRYYNVDATNDAARRTSLGTYSEFLLSEDNFSDHLRDADYASSDFYAAYPMAETDFDPDTDTVTNIDSDTDTDTDTNSVNESTHIWDDGVVTKNATIFTKGEMTYQCTICGKEKTEAIPRLPLSTIGRTILRAFQNLIGRFTPGSQSNG